MNELQIKILEGCLLGDGGLFKAKTGKNYYFQYSSSQLEHTLFISKHFLEFAEGTVYEKGFVKREVFDKRTNKTYTNYSFRTRTLPIFTEFGDKWYKDRIKEIPKDLQLTDAHCLYWYIGDGCLLRDSKSNKSADIKLATYCFTKDDVLFLNNQLKVFDAVVRYNESDCPYIRIRKRDTVKFLEYIGNDYPKCYDYKWNYSEYVNKQPTFTSIETFEIIKKKYIEGKSVYYLWKEFGVEMNSIKNYLKKDGTYKPRDVKKPLLQLDKNNQLIKKWNSLSEAARELNYNSSAISECCLGKRKQYKSFIWKYE
jgi:hypothetical protein